MPSGVTIAVPHLAASSTDNDLRALARSTSLQRRTSTNWCSGTTRRWRWRSRTTYDACAVVYDCMDELSAFAGASLELPASEARASRAGRSRAHGRSQSLPSKRRLHPNVHEFPSGVDVEHFASARQIHEEPRDQLSIPKPRIGFFGVIDERLDRELLAAIAAQAPGGQFVLIGPVTKINPGDSADRRQTCITSGRSATTICPATSPGGTSR